MNSNSLFEAASEGDKKGHKNDIVRTDFILENVFCYLVGDNFNFTAISAINKKEKDVFDDMKETLNAFKDDYSYSVKSLCAQIGIITEDTVGSILLGVSNEVFSEGITWSRIIAFFVFVGELAKMCIAKHLPVSIIDTIYDCFSVLVKDKLELWIEDHNGWEGITCLAIVAQQENSMLLSNETWAKSLLHTTVRVIGTLASVANTANNGFNKF